MIRKIMFVLLLLTVALIGVPQALAISDFLTAFNANYGTASTRLNTCDTCHIPGLTRNATNLNPYGKDVEHNISLGINQSLTNIEGNDSDGDSFTNIDEIHNLTFPGNGSDFPPKIISFSPTSPVASVQGGPTVTFIVTVNQPANVTWFVDNTQHQQGLTNTSNQSNHSMNPNEVNPGTHNVTAFANKSGDGSAMQKWVWNVTAAPVQTFNISGFKINDTNGNGVWNNGEMGIENWNIVLKNATTGAVINNTSTDANGSYKFMNLINGSYNVTEEMKTGFNPTNNTFRVVNISGKDITNINFTNNVSAVPPQPVPRFNISGFKINDTNGNGVWNNGEMGIENWNIILRNSTTGAVINSTSTDANGSYKFMNLTNGSYNVTEEMKTGFTPTNATFKVVTIAGQDISNLNFTNNVSVVPPKTFNISGFKINDTNGNGVWNNGEMGIENWNIILKSDTGTEIANISTGTNGFYRFTNLTNGTYNVTEGMKPGFTPTNATFKVVTIAGQDISNLNFTNNVSVVPPKTFNISGFKINDTNGNGVWNNGEMGIENWNIILKSDTGTEIANTSTDTNGFYMFPNLTNGTYNVTEGMRDGWAPTNNTSTVVTIAGQDIMNLNFTNEIVVPPVVVTSFELIPDRTAALNGSTISITIKALNVSVTETNFNGMANITINASNNASQIISPMNVSFTNGMATLPVTSSISQFVTVTATNNSINGSTTVVFADRVFDLNKGWNLISIPNFADPSNVSLALQNVKNNGVVGFDPATRTFSTPTDLQPLFGYWINVTADNQSIGFIASTTIPSLPPTRNLFEGWNLVGVSATRSDDNNSKNTEELFADLKLGTDFTQWLYSRLVSYDKGLTTPETLVAGIDLRDSTPLMQGHGYWLFVKGMPNTNKNNVPWAGKQW